MSETKIRPTFADRCRAECTRDVVFLFQVPHLIATGFPWTPDGQYGHDGEGILLGDVRGNLWEPREDAEYLTDEQLMGMETIDGIPCLIQEWRTISVFLTREEAEDHARDFGHRYRKGWRVYGVPSEGSLAELVRDT